MSYVKLIADIRESIKEDIDSDGIFAVADSYFFERSDVMEMSADEFVEACVAAETELMGK